MQQILVLMALFCVSVAALAAEPVGRLILAVGDVSALRAGSPVALVTGAAVEAGDEIRTGKASTAQIRFVDTGIVALRAETSFSVDEFIFKGEQDGGEKAIFKLVKGGLRTITGLIGRLHPKTYGIVTPTSTIGIRGTHFNLVVCEGNCRNADGTLAPSGTYGGVVDGSITLTPNQNPGGERVFARGDYFFASDSASPAKPLLVPPSFIADRLEAQQRATSQPGLVAGAASPAATAATPAATSVPPAAPSNDVVAGAAPPAASTAAPLPYVAPESLAATGSIPVVGKVTGFIAQYVATSGYGVVESCGGAITNCQSNQATQFVASGNQLISFSNSPATNPVGNLAGGNVVDGGSVTIAGSQYAWGRWTGNFSVTDANGTYTNLPSGLMFGMTDDPWVSSQTKVLPTTGNVSYVLAGGPRPVDTAGNPGTITNVSGSIDFVTRNVTFAANLSIASATLSMTGNGILAAQSDSLKAAALTSGCSGVGCASASQTGLFDARFAGTAAQVMVVNGIVFNAVGGPVGPSQSVMFLNVLKCTSAGC